MDDDSVRAMLALLGEQKRLLRMLELPGGEGKGADGVCIMRLMS